MDALRRQLEAVVCTTSVPSVSLTVRVDGAEVFHHTTGVARHRPCRAATDDQPYDLASLTKVLCTVPLVAALIDHQRIEPDAPVAEHVPGVDPRITLWHLLEHSSGYPAHVPLYEGLSGSWGSERFRQALLERATRTPLLAPPGSQHRYSDLGFLVLLRLIESATAMPLQTLAQIYLYGPAGIHDLRWGWPRAAATERCPLRKRVVEGEVHDLNTAAMGGISTHAGLFGTAREVCRWVDILMHATLDDPHHSALPGARLAQMWSRPGVGGHRGGWDTVSPGGSSTGRHFPPDTRGHLGFTGTSVWCSPSRRTVVALLTNRVHPHDDRETIRLVRPKLHDAVARALGWG